jgi:hypothetical protein
MVAKQHWIRFACAERSFVRLIVVLDSARGLGSLSAAIREKADWWWATD